jgi:hypothetical protein
LRRADAWVSPRLRVKSGGLGEERAHYV